MSNSSDASDALNKLIQALTGTSAAKMFLGSRPFDTFNADEGRRFKGALGELAKLDVESLDTVFISVLSKGPPTKCDSCDEDHASADVMTFIIGDDLTLRALITSALEDLSEKGTLTDHKEKIVMAMGPTTPQ